MTLKIGNIPWNKGLKGYQVAWNKGIKFPELSGVNSPAWKLRTVKKCKACSNEFKVEPSKLHLKFCSQKCYWSSLKGRKLSSEWRNKISKSHKSNPNIGWFTSERTSGNKNINWRGDKPKCVDCNKKLSDFDHKRCKSCSLNSQKGKGHWNWQGGISKDKTAWQRKRKKIRYNTDNNYRMMILSHSHKRNGKGNINLKVFQAVYEDNIKKYGTLTCYLCLIPIEFKKDCLEHKIPISRGGTNDYENLAIAHRSCNVKKHNKTEEEFRKLGVK